MIDTSLLYPYHWKFNPEPQSSYYNMQQPKDVACDLLNTSLAQEGGLTETNTTWMNQCILTVSSAIALNLLIQKVY